MPPFIDWPADDGSDDGAWLRAARDGGLTITEYDHLIHDAGADSADGHRVPPRGVLSNLHECRYGGKDQPDHVTR